MSYYTTLRGLDMKKYSTPIAIYNLLQGKTASYIIEAVTTSNLKSMLTIVSIEPSPTWTKHQMASAILSKLNKMNLNGEL
ncbi:hypothetical protein [Paenibacillus sp. FSL P4-0288]|uniref:hypothetical protein n=1 Tax=Paenibacillus sp. FSL P4-0288 TaxID=2921633 RepID=UPI0030FBC039